MTVFEKARELGELILKSEESLRLADARDVYNKDAEAKEKMNEYMKRKDEVTEKARKGEYEEGEYTQEVHELHHMVSDLKKDPIIGAMIFAENEFNGLVNKAMSVLRATITGETEESCGDCGSCSGCGN